MLKKIFNTVIPRGFHPRMLAKAVTAKIYTDQRVVAGPFAGMRYVAKSIGSVLPPKLLGIYEKELHGYLENHLNVDNKVILDVGAAEGYYAVGLALACPNARIFAFEADPDGQLLIGEMALANGVASRVSVAGYCSGETFLSTINESQPDMIVMDIEGGESELLSEEAVKKLARSVIIVETHPWVDPDVNKVLIDRLSKTHVVEIIKSEERLERDVPLPRILQIVFGRWLREIASEDRPIRMTWLCCTPIFSGQAQ